MVGLPKPSATYTPPHSQCRGREAVGLLGSTETYSQDLEGAQRLRFLVEQGYVDSLVEAAIRFPLGNTGVSSVLVGYSSMEHLEQSVRWASKGPLPSEAMAGLRDAWAQMRAG